MLIKILTTIFLFQLILSAIFTQIMAVDLLSFSLGGAISFINFAVLAILWMLIIYKKRVAPAVSVVVIKYGILIYLFMKIPQINWVHQNDLVYGIIINPVAVVIGGFFLKNISKNK